MKDLCLWRPLALACAAGFCSAGHAAVAYDEAVSGDLSSAFGSPTFIVLATGTNDVLGTTGGTNGAPERDYFSFTLTAGQALSEVRLLAGTTLATPTDRAFLGIYSGSVAVSPAINFPILGYTLFGAAQVGTDLLPSIAAAPVTPQFTPPLGAGAYTFWVQDSTNGITNYGLQLVVTSVPEPASTATLLAGLLLLGGLAWRRRQG